MIFSSTASTFRSCWSVTTSTSVADGAVRWSRSSPSRNRTKTSSSLIEAGSRYGFAVEVIRPIYVGDIVVHSTEVRRAVGQGDVALARELLGRPHKVQGRIVSGAGRGRNLGFATANLAPRTECVPSEGVYSTVSWLDGEPWEGVTSIGHTPTFGGTQEVIEAHIFGDPGDLYGRPMTLEFIDRLRDQRTFDSPDELVQQIERDVADARASLERWRA